MKHPLDGTTRTKGENLLDSSSPECEHWPYGVFTLMNVFEIKPYNRAYGEFTNWSRHFQNNRDTEGVVHAKTILDLAESLERLQQQCQIFGLDAVVSLLSFSRFEMKSPGSAYFGKLTHNDIEIRLSRIDFMFRDQAEKQVFFRLSSEESEKFANDELFGPEVAEAFPSDESLYEIREAGSCFALGRYTASVFHLMRVLEKGLKALADDLQVAFSIPFEYENWQNIIEQIEAKIRELEKQAKGQKKTDALKTYSEIARQFRYFKDAWRNGVAHSREVYDEHGAASIFAHVKEFMQDISKHGLKETV